MSDNVQVKVTEIRRRTASFVVPIGDTGRKLTAKVNAKAVMVASETGSYGRYAFEIPKTIEAVNMLSDLVDAIRRELNEQGVTE